MSVRVRLVCTLFIVFAWTAAAGSQPVETPPEIPPAVFAAVGETVKTLIESAGSDDGWRGASPIVAGASSDPRLPRAWKAWRARLMGNDRWGMRLGTRDMKLRDYHPGETEDTVTAMVRYRIAIGDPHKPESPAVTWLGQDDLLMVKPHGTQDSWRIIPPQSPNYLIELAEALPERLPQIAFAVSNPAAVLMTERYHRDRINLNAMAEAVDSYVARNGRYPPDPYFAALLTRNRWLRPAFQVSGTTRQWVLNPRLAGRPMTAADKGLAGQGRVPLFWDGPTGHPYALYSGRALIAFAGTYHRPDGRERRVDLLDPVEARALTWRP